MKHLKITLGTALLGSFALAQTAVSPLQIVLSQSRVEVVQQGGKPVEQLVAVKDVRPGDLLHQSIQASNTSDKTLRNIALQLPVPATEVFVSADSSAYPTTFSIDGGKSFHAAPFTKQVTVTENGKTTTKDVAVQSGEYTNVRWAVPMLGAKQSVSVTARFKVR